MIIGTFSLIFEVVLLDQIYRITPALEILQLLLAEFQELYEAV